MSRHRSLQNGGAGERSSKNGRPQVEQVRRVCFWAGRTASRLGSKFGGPSGSIAFDSF
jgi:hypothetical protein